MAIKYSGDTTPGGQLLPNLTNRVSKTGVQPSAPKSNLDFDKVGDIYKANDVKFPAPAEVEQTVNGGKERFKGIERIGKPSIFNRYSVFFFNNQNDTSAKPENYFDSPERIGDATLQKVRNEPTAKNIIEWSKNLRTGAVEYAWEDFLWCKNYGVVPNNYLVTLRRFTIPPDDDLFSSLKNTNPDIGRMITFVDGVKNKWDTVGLKWAHHLNFREMKSELQEKQEQVGAGNEAGAFQGLPGGNLLATVAKATDTGASKGRLQNKAVIDFNPYQNNSIVFGPIDVVAKTNLRERGLEFTQNITLVFEYQLRSIDGINAKVAMIDLLSNVMICTMNRGTFWGGDIRYYGHNPRRLKPIGDPNKLAAGDNAGYFESLGKGFQNMVSSLTGGKGLFEGGLETAAKTIGGNLLSSIAGGALDKMGRPGIQAINSLLSGEPTGEWHITIGNPANPIISIGNMILKETEVELGGPLGFDDFPTKVTITCTLSPGRPRDRTEIMNMFSRSGRTYLTSPPQATKYTGNIEKGTKGAQSKKMKKGQNKETLKEADFTQINPDLVRFRFPHHTAAIAQNSAIGIY